MTILKFFEGLGFIDAGRNVCEDTDLFVRVFIYLFIVFFSKYEYVFLLSQNRLSGNICCVLTLHLWENRSPLMSF
jgi:hypothetical protein